jgi:hypothetical protein
VAQQLEAWTALFESPEIHAYEFNGSVASCPAGGGA